MEKGKINRMKLGTILGIVLVSFLVVGLSTFQTLNKPEASQKPGLGHLNFPVVGEDDPGSGNTGWLEIYIYPHDGDPGTTYAENTSATLEAASLAYADSDGWSESLVSETSFDIVVRVRWNKTHVWQTDKFIDSRARTNITVTCDDWAVGSNIDDATGTLVVSRNDTSDDFIWCNIYWNNGGSGYQIADDATLTVSEISIEAKF